MEKLNFVLLESNFIKNILLENHRLIRDNRRLEKQSNFYYEEYMKITNI